MKKRYVVKKRQTKSPESESDSTTEYYVYDTLEKKETFLNSIVEQDIEKMCDFYNNFTNTNIDINDLTEKKK
jgi:hypothetical protein